MDMNWIFGIGNLRLGIRIGVKHCQIQKNSVDLTLFFGEGRGEVIISSPLLPRGKRQFFLR